MNVNHLRIPLAFVASLLVAASAWGFAYINDQRTSGTPLPIKWPPGTVSIQIKLGTNQTLSDGTNFSTSAQGAAQTWNAQIGNLQITSQIAPVAAATDHNHVNELVFASDVFGKAFDSGVIAVTTTWVSGNDRTEGDILFNSARTWDSYDGPRRGNTIDLQRVAIHEMGHLLGLDHPDDFGQTVTAIMNSHISDLDTLAADDITGVQNLYGPPGIPANDNFANAINLAFTSTPVTNVSSTITATGFNTNATKQTGEPNHGSNAGGRSVWWKWTAPAAGPVTIDTIGSYFDTTLGVYTGSAVGSLTTIAGNDDINSGVVQASKVTFTAVGGTTYFIAVDGFNSPSDTNGADSAGITLNLAFTPTGAAVPVITSQPANATVTTGGSVSFTVAATGATGYQWQFNGTNIGGATSTTYSISNVSASQAGSYRVVVSNDAGSVNSDSATLTVNTPAPVVTPPASSGGGGGGGGAPSLWFYGALSLLGLARFFRRR